MVKKLIRKIIYKEKADNDTYIAYLKRIGVKVGDNVRFFSMDDFLVDTTYPWLLSFGNNVTIARGVTILTHDGSWAVYKRDPKTAGIVLGAQAPVTIGNNVFLGINCVINRGVTIGDNVIIGVGSVVTNDCEPDSLYLGCPARRVMSIDEFRKKREEKQFDEARTLALKYYEVFGTRPPIEVFAEYFMLFATLDQVLENSKLKKKMRAFGGYDECVTYMKNYKPRFNGYESFLDECFKN